MKKSFLIIIVIISVLMINTCVAQDNHDLNSTLPDNVENTHLSISIEECGNATNIIDASDKLSQNEPEDKISSDMMNTSIIAEDSITYNKIGDYYTVKLVDNKNSPVSNVNLKISILNNVNTVKTDNNGQASLLINLKDGTYNIITEFEGNSKYNPCSKTSTITVKNTIEIDEGLTGKEIQKIINSANENNVILFKGSEYNDVNLIIEKSLTLISNCNTVLKSSSSSPTITIKGQKSSLTTINGFNIQSKGDGIKVEGNQYVDIINNKITANGNGIVALDTDNLNIENNKIEGNGKTGICIALTKNTYILNNNINKNDYGIGISESENTYIYKNTISNNQKDGILVSDEINNVYYGKGPKNLHIESNTITNNGGNGINLIKTEDGLVINKNTLNNNGANGILMDDVKSNKITSNNIRSNGRSGIKFAENYILPKEQTIDGNVMLNNHFREMDAQETFYDEGYARLIINGTNWFGDNPNLCPKIKASNYNLIVEQISSYFFNVRFEDANGNVASGLPSMTGSTKTNNGRTTYFIINNGTAIFERDATDGDTITTNVDGATRTNKYKFDDSSYIDMPVAPYDPYLRPLEDVGKPYPDRSKPGLISDIKTHENTDEESTPGNSEGGSGSGDNGGTGSGSGSGHGTGDGSGDGTGSGGNGNSNGQNGGNSTNNSEFYGNSTTSQNTNPGNTAQNPSTSQSSNTAQATSSSASSQGPANSANSESSPSNSVVKQIILEEEELIRISGMSFLILLILLTVIYYYRDDIKEMKSRM